MTYVHNNYECVVSLLDYVAHKKPQPAYVYASSSSRLRPQQEDPIQ